MSHNFEFSFTLEIHRVAVDLTITDRAVLDKFNQGQHRVTELVFTRTGDNTTLSGKTCSYGEAAAYGYMYIDYGVTEHLCRWLALHQGIGNYSITEPRIELTNRAALTVAGVPAYALERSYVLGELVKPKSEPSPSGFLDSLERLDGLSRVECLDDVLHFMHLSNTVSPDKATYTEHDIMNKFRYTWSAFNALYDAETKSKGDKASIIEFSRKDMVIAFLGSGRCGEYVDVLKSAGLQLRNKDNVSEKLAEALRSGDAKGISENVLLCVYAIRNSNFHGTIDESADYCRVGYEVIHGLIQEYLIKNSSACLDV